MATIQTRDDVRTEPPAMDYRAHQRQYNRFLHLLKWFIGHLAFLIPALYFYIVAGQGITGTLLLLIALGVLAYGVFSTGGIEHDLEEAVGSVAHPGREDD